jgi:hypothetical protein
MDMLQRRGGAADLQTPFEAAVVIPTVLRPTLARAVASVYAQELPPGTRLQLLIGIDIAEGDRALLDRLAAECPDHIAFMVFDPGYSTSVRHGGLYPNRYSGALRTILSYAANSRYVAYLDDDNWWAPDHVASLLAAIAQTEWAFSQRWFVEAETGEPICLDEWESVGPDAGIFLEKFGGFVDPSSLMLDKFAAHDILPFWSLSPFADGSGEDRLVFASLKGALSGRPSGRATSYYTINPADPMQSTRLQQMRERGVVLPSQRRAGIRQLADSVPATPDFGPAGQAAPDALLGETIQRLKPREILVLADAATARSVAAQARRRDPTAVTVAPGVADAALGLRAWPDRPLEKLAVDLIRVAGASGTAELIARCRRLWPLLRPGGLVFVDRLEAGAVESFEHFIVESGARALPASLEACNYLLLEKP